MILRPKAWLVVRCLVAIAFAATPNARAQAPAAGAAQPPAVDWSAALGPTNRLGSCEIKAPRGYPGVRFFLPTPAPNLTGVYGIDGLDREPLIWEFNADASQLEIKGPAMTTRRAAREILIETAEKTAQFGDGRIVFSALDAQVSGQRAKLETSPGNHRIGFWTDPGDSVSWPFKPTRWGAYDLELTYSADGGDGTELVFEIAGQTFTVARPATGSWYRYTTLPVGRLHLAKSDPFTLRVSCRKMTGGAVMNLKAVTLRPAPEGGAVAQDQSGAVTLRAGDAITHSVTMRYEPASAKNCLGYWVNPSDWAEWQFTVSRPGTFEMELTQGCGKGQDGSDVAVELAGKRVEFVVAETGHFQIFLPRRLGRFEIPAAGTYSLAVRPQRKQAGAIMDCRQVKLVPVTPPAKSAVANSNPGSRGALPDEIQFPGKRSLWFGFERFDFEVDGKPVLVVAPKQAAPGRPWAWHGEFFGHKPEPDLALLGRGFHIVYLSVPDMLGCPEAVGHWNALYRELTAKYGLAKKAALVGLSRGGLYCYNWATENPTRVACIYGDAPVCDFKSWPGGKGKGPGSPRDWQLVLERYHFASESEALAYPKNPIDRLAPLAAAKVPLLHVYGDADEVVPWQENTGIIAERYRRLGGKIQLIAKAGVKHHPHGLDDSTPIVDFIWANATTPEAKAWLASRGGGPQNADGRPLIRRLGTIDLDLVETTPVVFHGQLLRFEWVREGYWDNQRKTNYFRFVNHETGEVSAPFGDGHEFGSAYVEGDTVYVTGTIGRGAVDLFVSRDLKNWETRPVIADGRYGIFNTSMWKAANEYVLMFEIDRPLEEAGTPFTARFARSSDLRSWQITPPECNYAKDRYTAPHCLRWLDGWYYDFYLEAHDGYELRVVRSRDLIHWEPSPLNPVLRAAPEDKLIANAKLTEAQRGRVANAVNLNNSDIDFCEWQGRLQINYSWGNQQGVEHLAEALYDGSLAQFLHGWFPGK